MTDKAGLLNSSVVELYSLLHGCGYTFSVAESCTGGGLGAALTSVPGSSRYFKGGVIAYSDEVKRDVLGIPAGLLAQYGAGSEQTAREMSQQVRLLFHSDIGISITGIAGPDGGTSEKPVGLVFISITTPQETVVEECRFGGSREEIRVRSIDRAIVMTVDLLQAL